MLAVATLPFIMTSEEVWGAVALSGGIESLGEASYNYVERIYNYAKHCLANGEMHRIRLKDPTNNQITEVPIKIASTYTIADQLIKGLSAATLSFGLISLFLNKNDRTTLKLLNPILIMPIGTSLIKYFMNRHPKYKDSPTAILMARESYSEEALAGLPLCKETFLKIYTNRDLRSFLSETEQPLPHVRSIDDNLAYCYRVYLEPQTGC